MSTRRIRALQSLNKVENYLLDQLQLHIKRLQDKINEVEEEIIFIREEWHHQQVLLLNPIEQGLTWQAYTQGQQAKIENLSDYRNRLTKELELAREQLNEFFKDVKSHEIALKQSIQLQAKEEERKEQNQLDDMAQSNFIAQINKKL